VLAMLIVIAIGFGVWTNIRHQQQQAIVAVLSQFETVRTEYRNSLTTTKTFPNGRTVTVPARNMLQLSKNYIAKVNRIATGDCPQAFQFAWLDFVQTLQRSEEPFSGLGAVGEYVVSVAQPSSAGAKDALARLDKLNIPEAWRRVQVVAIQYGVQMH
jgi:hypothetical protein